MSKHSRNSHEEEDDNEFPINGIQEEIMGSQQEETLEDSEGKNSDIFGEKPNDGIISLQKKCEEYYAMFLRISADFDNYKKRTAKERETVYQDATAEAVQAFVPVLDNFERAVKAQDSNEISEGESAYKAGVELLFRQFKEAFVKLGVKEIKSLGEKFDPNLHNAVMHIDDQAYGDGEIIEELQKGYLIGEKVVRHSMVKVAN